MRTLLKLPTFGIDRTLAAPVASPEESRRSLSINSSTSFGFFRSSAVWPLIDGILFFTREAELRLVYTLCADVFPHQFVHIFQSI